MVELRHETVTTFHALEEKLRRLKELDDLSRTELTVWKVREDVLVEGFFGSNEHLLLLKCYEDDRTLLSLDSGRIETFSSYYLLHDTTPWPKKETT